MNVRRGQTKTRWEDLNLRMLFSICTSQTTLKPTATANEEEYRQGSHVGWRGDVWGALEGCEHTRVMYRLSVDMKGPQHSLVVWWL